MSFPSLPLRARLVPALGFAVALSAAFSLAGCKQDVGERCEQNSDCSSGICGDGTGGMASAAGKRCAASLFPPSSFDSAAPVDTGSADANAALDAVDAISGDTSGDAASLDAPGAETSPDGALGDGASGN